MAIAFTHHHPETRAERLLFLAVAAQSCALYARFSFWRVLIYREHLPFAHASAYAFLAMDGVVVTAQHSASGANPCSRTRRPTNLDQDNIATVLQDLSESTEIPWSPSPARMYQSAVSGGLAIAGAAFNPKPIA